MSGAGEKTFDILVSDVGEVRLIVRPPLPFHAEGFRVIEGRMEIYGEGLVTSAPIPEERSDDMRSAEQALLIEFDRDGGESRRETDLMKEE